MRGEKPLDRLARHSTRSDGKWVVYELEFAWKDGAAAAIIFQGRAVVERIVVETEFHEDNWRG